MSTKERLTPGGSRISQENGAEGDSYSLDLVNFGRLREKESGLRYHLSQLEDAGAGPKLLERIKNVLAEALVLFQFGDDCMDER